MKELTEETIPDSLKPVLDYAKERFLAQKRIHNEIIILRNNELKIINVALFFMKSVEDIQAAKDQVVDLMILEAGKLGTQSICFVMEAWTLERPAEVEAQSRKIAERGEVYKQPDKKEAVVVSYSDKSNHNIVALGKIDRKIPHSPILLPWVYLEGGTEGRFVNIFDRAHSHARN